ncbi:MAG TPA: Gfo/Idh/MocA family oxidoreductase, partial [Planctomycetota bacterium]|nr:Gfo/Idh/MocA family oxidoreductase [Planctomycetota bacterium]
MLKKCVITLSLFTASIAFAGEILKAGIIGLDTSHVTAFTKELNAATDLPGDIGGIKVVAGFPGGSDDIPSSKDRVAGFTEGLKKMNVEIVDSIDTLLTKVDVVLLESVDGRPHLQQVLPVLKAKKPVFIDKPVAGTLADAIEIFRIAKEMNVPIFSSSSLRFEPGVAGAKSDPKIGDVLGCDAYGHFSYEPHHPDLFWYGIHGVEELFTIMGPGCESVTRVKTKDYEIVVGVWKDGRVGQFRGILAGKQDYGAMVYGSKGIAPISGFGGYKPLVAEIAKFFKT